MQPLLLNETAVIGMAALLFAIIGVGAILGLGAIIVALYNSTQRETGGRLWRLFQRLLLVALLVAFVGVVVLVIYLFQVGLSD